MMSCPQTTGSGSSSCMSRGLTLRPAGRRARGGRALLPALLVVAACGAHKEGASASAPSTVAASTDSPASPSTTLAAPSGKLMTVREARRYMVELINRDRAEQHLKPVELDEDAPTRSGQRHAED